MNLLARQVRDIRPISHSIMNAGEPDKWFEFRAPPLNWLRSDEQGQKPD
jgi:hypothetical protein